MRKILILLVLLGLPSLSHAREPTFERDIQPILTRYGCNAGACHGKARGQNGFSLSLLAYDPDADFAAITEEARGRRLFPANPEFSLLLRKASGEVPHGGGKKLPKDDPNYATLKQWIASGTPRTPKTAAKLVGIAVNPREKIMTFGTTVPLQITANYSDGSTEDVTRMSQFQSNDSTYAAVDAFGKIVAGPLPGEAAVMARFQNTFAVCNILIPLPGTVDAKYYETLPRKNFIDGHVWNKLKQLAITPSDPCPDATFHRRAFLDVIGRLPTPTETTAFLKDTDPKKRDTLIDRLLERPEYGDFWANKWADLLRPNPYHAGIKATFNYDSWIRESFRKNKPYDQFVREILTAQGSSFRNGAVVFYRNRRQPDELTTMASQLFLGIRLDCAKCHHHPFEVYSQDDFYSFAAFFARLGHTGQGISAPISGGEETFYVKPTGTVKHPLTDKAMSPRPLLGQDLVIPPEDDPRVVLAKWVTAPENPTFAKVIANRVWADLMGRGIVDPVDDLRATNPPTNGPLLDELAADFRKGGCNMKSLIRRIATSHAYGLNSTPRDRNIGDIRNYSRHYRQRLRAEVLLDAVTDITGVNEKFEAMSPGSRAMESWTVRFDSKFLDSFGRPDPNQDPPCERSSETTVVQALHLMNSPNIQRKITDDNGNAAILAKSDKTPAAIVREIYLLIYCREPSVEETAKCVARFEKKNAIRREATEDLMWALLNTPEFAFND